MNPGGTVAEAVDARINDIPPDALRRRDAWLWGKWRKLTLTPPTSPSHPGK